VSNAGSQAYKFYEDVSKNQALWIAERANGIALEFDVKGGRVSFPLWSSRSRIVRLKRLNPDLLKEFEPREISWADFKATLAPILIEKDRLVGVNLSGKNISGFEMSVDSVIRQVESLF
jgi:hypothetical protein